MDRTYSRKKDWKLTPEAFELLLTRLGKDRDSGAEKYEQIRNALQAYFEHHGSLSPAELTDATFDQVARSLSSGKDIYIEDPAGYFFGVARNILREYRRETAGKFVPLDELQRSSGALYNRRRLLVLDQERSEHERRMDCIEKCLDALSSENQVILLKYYEGETGVKIRNRKALAASLRISVGLLRVRALRLRGHVEVCAEKCLAAV